MSDPYFSSKRKQIKKQQQTENFQYFFTIFIASLMAGAMALVLYVVSLPSIAQLANYEPTLTSQVVASDGTVIKTFGAYKSERVTIEEMPDNLKNALIATEDKNFYHHKGFDVIALMRSTASNILAGRIVQGASTITQQLARILFLNQEKTFDRKFKELILAFRLEKSIPKKQILEMYLNNVYLGEGAYGVEAASEVYFNKKVSQLTLAESALIAGLPQAPSVYSPYQNMELALKRRSKVLKRMADEGYITPEQAGEANSSPIVLSAETKHTALKKAPYFVDYVMRELKDKTGLTEDEVIQGGYKIYTTLNYDMQRAAEKAVASNLRAWHLVNNYNQAALLSYDTNTGGILAYIGGKDYMESQFDRVHQAVRQPGSSFKPFVYAAAMEKGLTPFTKYADRPITIAKWSPQNYGRKYRGEIPLYKALAYSSNAVAVRLIQDVGVEDTIRMAERLGITTDIAHDPTIALGSSAVKLIDMATAYGVFANGGVKVEPYSIERVETNAGRIVYQASASYKRILDAKTVAYMVEMLKQVVTQGTGRASAIGRPSAGKTGTTDSYKDAWFMGFTPDIVTGVWVGNDNNMPNRNLTGGTVPALIWRDYMKTATSNKPVADFMYPDIIVDKIKDNSKVEDVKETNETSINNSQESNSTPSEDATQNTDADLNNLDFKETPKKSSRQNYQDEPDLEETPSNPRSAVPDFKPAPVPVAPAKLKPVRTPVEPPLPGQKTVGNAGF
jgi:penicillin-binding protein 1A